MTSFSPFSHLFSSSPFFRFVSITGPLLLPVLFSPPSEIKTIFFGPPFLFESPHHKPFPANPFQGLPSVGVIRTLREFLLPPLPLTLTSFFLLLFLGSSKLQPRPLFFLFRASPRILKYWARIGSPFPPMNSSFPLFPRKLPLRFPCQYAPPPRCPFFLCKKDRDFLRTLFSDPSNWFRSVSC